MAVTSARVFAQSSGDGGVQWHLSLFVLPGAHVHRTAGEIDVGAVEPERFAEPQPG